MPNELHPALYVGTWRRLDNGWGVALPTSIDYTGWIVTVRRRSGVESRRLLTELVAPSSPGTGMDSPRPALYHCERVPDSSPVNVAALDDVSIAEPVAVVRGPRRPAEVPVAAAPSLTDLAASFGVTIEDEADEELVKERAENADPQALLEAQLAELRKKNEDLTAELREAREVLSDAHEETSRVSSELTDVRYDLRELRDEAERVALDTSHEDLVIAVRDYMSGIIDRDELAAYVNPLTPSY